MAPPIPQRKQLYLVETSALRPALGSPSAKHNKHFAEAVQGGDLHTSVYIRMEFVRHWICYFIRAALYIYNCDNVSHALYLLGQKFGRGPKDALTVVEQHLERSGTMSNSSAAAEETASITMRLLERFDAVFRSRTENACKCEIGANTPSVDYDNVLRDLYALHEEFIKPVLDCQINKFLKHRRRGESLTKNSSLADVDAVKNLAEFEKKSKWITCKECQGIGDAVIALEQPATHSLVHIDHAFNKLCPILGRDHKPIASAVAADPIELKPPPQKDPEKL